jgi:hypothetical protein
VGPDEEVTTPTRVSLGGHNLLDGDGTPTAFADIIGFTEAPARAVVRRSLGWRVRGGYRLFSKGDPSMILALRVGLFGPASSQFHMAHRSGQFYGIPNTTPMRGTLVVKTRTKAGRKVAFMVSHRINKSERSHQEPSMSEAERKLRAALYADHEALDIDLADGLLKHGFPVVAIGDYNRHGGLVFDGMLDERGQGADRICASHSVYLGPISWLGHVGSDHPRALVENARI